MLSKRDIFLLVIWLIFAQFLDVFKVENNKFQSKKTAEDLVPPANYKTRFMAWSKLFKIYKSRLTEKSAFVVEGEMQINILYWTNQGLLRFSVKVKKANLKFHFIFLTCYYNFVIKSWNLKINRSCGYYF
jgi:hypothetical protein